jgi:predicted transcriptional regulator
MTETRNRGELEAAIMSILWDSPQGLTAQEVRGSFVDAQPAITTVITVLDRLRRKELVTRTSLPGQSHVFSTTRTRDEDVATTMANALESTPDRTLALLRFAGALSESDREFLRRAIDGS